jgi:hypothetical protein
MKNKILFFIFTLLLFHMASGNGPTMQLNKKKIQKMEQVDPPRQKTQEELEREKKKKYEERKMRWLMEHEAHYPQDL